jgi:lipoprotein-anchoring transpeptidase ErfK/SrfK
MIKTSRRKFLADAAAFASLAALAACTTATEAEIQAAAVPANPFAYGQPNYALMYGPRPNEKFPIAAVDLTQINPAFLRAEVYYPTDAEPGTIVIDPAAHYLYYTQPYGRAIRYGVGVGKQGFEWSGDAYINSKQEWPDWYPPPEMIARRPDIAPQLQQLQSGMGVPGGPRNPIGARGLYLWQNNKDTLYRIHGTNEPQTIGLSVSSGCIRMINQDVIDLYDRVPIGTKVKVLGAGVA